MVEWDKNHRLRLCGRFRPHGIALLLRSNAKPDIGKRFLLVWNLEWMNVCIPFQKLLSSFHWRIEFRIQKLSTTHGLWKSFRQQMVKRVVCELKRASSLPELQKYEERYLRKMFILLWESLGRLLRLLLLSLLTQLTHFWGPPAIRLSFFPLMETYCARWYSTALQLQIFSKRGTLSFTISHPGPHFAGFDLRPYFIFSLRKIF